MATKPLAAFTFATNTLYDVGPSSGNNTKEPVSDLLNGWVPGVGISAEQANTLLNLIGVWLTEWVLEGSSNPVPTEDAHIVETASTGEIFVVKATIGTALYPSTALRVLNTGPNTASFENSGAGSALKATASAVNGTLEAAVFEGTRNANAPIASFYKLGAGAHQRGAIWLDTQQNPSAIVDGDIWKVEGTGGSTATRGSLRYSDGAEGGKIIVAHATEKGYYFNHDEDRSESSTTSALPQEKLSLSCPVGSGGKYKVTFSCAIKVSTGIADKVVAVIFDTGVAGKTETYKINFPDPDLYMPVSATWLVDGNVATIVNSISFFSKDGTSGVSIKDAEIFFEGAHDLIV